MAEAYVVGHITIKDPEKWAEYRAKVPATLGDWKGELVFRGKRNAVLAGHFSPVDIVVIRFPSLVAVNSWFESVSYQSLIPLREAAAEVILVSYEASP
jgi:uncharacterized protein (DUF1330 family)